jgi:hypothetical protein
MSQMLKRLKVKVGYKIVDRNGAAAVELLEKFILLKKFQQKF